MSKIEKTDAIVLKSSKLRESSLIITFFTRDFGKIRTISKGVRKKKSPLLRHFEPFTYQEIVFYHHPKREINLITDSTIKESFFFIRYNFQKICYASYMVELVDEVTQLNQTQRNLFEVLLYSLCELKDISSTKLLRFFEIKVLDCIGIFPNLKKCVVCGNRKLSFHMSFSFRHGGIVCARPTCLGNAPDAIPISAGCISSILFLKSYTVYDLSRFHPSKVIADEMKNVLQQCISFYLNRELRSIQFMREVSEVFPVR